MANESSDFASDKQLHYALSFGFYYQFRTMGLDEIGAVACAMAIGLAKEIKDALIPYELYPAPWGSAGFSTWDLIYDGAGVGVALGGDLTWQAIVYVWNEWQDDGSLDKAHTELEKL